MPAEELARFDDQKILYAIEGAERYRTRARSVATITATGAGALAAGLVLNSSSNFSSFTKFWGLTSIILLLLSTAVFVVASVVHSRTASDGKKNRLGIVLRPWETLYSPQDNSTDSALLHQSDAVLARILKTMDGGMWLAGAAVLSLVVALISVPFSPPVHTVMELSYLKDKPQIAKCPNLPQTFRATALKSDLDKNASHLLVTVSADSCDLTESRPVSFYVNRDNMLILIETRNNE